MVKIHSSSEAVVLLVVERHELGVLLVAVLEELVLVVGQSLEVLDDALENLQLLVGQLDLLALVAALDDLGSGQSGSLGPEVDVVTVLSDGLSPAALALR